LLSMFIQIYTFLLFDMQTLISGIKLVCCLPDSHLFFRINFSNEWTENERKENEAVLGLLSSSSIYIFLFSSLLSLSVIVERKKRKKNNRRQLEQMARWFIWAENWVYYHYVIMLMTWRFDWWYDDYPNRCQNSNQKTDLINLSFSHANNQLIQIFTDVFFLKKFQYVFMRCSRYKIFINVWSLSFFFYLPMKQSRSMNSIQDCLWTKK
jgi:hypothetical protein